MQFILEPPESVDNDSVRISFMVNELSNAPAVAESIAIIQESHDAGETNIADLMFLLASIWRQCTKKRPPATGTIKT
jgi:hypothetical protein